MDRGSINDEIPDGQETTTNDDSTCSNSASDAQGRGTSTVYYGIVVNPEPSRFEVKSNEQIESMSVSGGVVTEALGARNDFKAGTLVIFRVSSETQTVEWLRECAKNDAATGETGEK